MKKQTQHKEKREAVLAKAKQFLSMDYVEVFVALCEEVMHFVDGHVDPHGHELDQLDRRLDAAMADLKSSTTI